VSTLDAWWRPLMMRVDRRENRRGAGLARARSDKSLARFDRIAMVLSGGVALGAYQAGAYAALENCGGRPNWTAGTGVGAIEAAVDFDRVNSGSVRVVLGAVNLLTGAETYFDNDRHVLGPEHVLASAALPGLPPTIIDNQRYGGSAVSVAALDDARPADTLCFVIDGYDPVPGTRGGVSRSAREIAALRHNHDLRRMIALLGERVPPALRGNADIRKCLAEASNATMTIL